MQGVHNLPAEISQHTTLSFCVSVNPRRWTARSEVWGPDGALALGALPGRSLPGRLCLPAVPCCLACSCQRAARLVLKACAVAILMELGGRDLIGSEDDLERFNRHAHVCCLLSVCLFSLFSNSEANMRINRDAVTLREQRRWLPGCSLAEGKRKLTPALRGVMAETATCGLVR